MKEKRILKVLIGIVALILVGAVMYGIARDDDAYQYYTGLGDAISISPDDQHIAFSYYVDGKEAIYTANTDGTDVQKVVESEDKRLHDPKYAFDGSQILYKGENSEGTDVLFIVDHDGNNSQQLTGEKLHVEETVFSPADKTVYYTGMNAEEFKKEPGETKAGSDLFSIQPGDGGAKQLTDKNYPSMSNLIVSPDEQQVLFSQYTGGDQVYSIKDEAIESAIIKGFPGDDTTYHPAWTPDQKKMAFTNVSKESRNTSLYKYDLFLRDTSSGDTERLTDLGAAIESPVFFHQQDNIAFLENTNWPNEPKDFLLRTVNFDGGALTTIDLNVPNVSKGNGLNKTLDMAASSYTIGVLYLLLLGLITVYFERNGKKRSYLPAIISFVLAIGVLITSFILAAFVNPWLGIGLMTLAIGIFVSSLIVLIFAFILRRFTRVSSSS